MVSAPQAAGESPGARPRGTDFAMIICHCNVISCGDLRKAVDELRGEDAHAMVTPAGVFRCCGKRPRCGSCMPLVSGLIREEIAAAPARR